VKHKGKKVK